MTQIIIIQIIIFSADDEASYALTESQHSLSAIDNGNAQINDAVPSEWELDPSDRRPSVEPNENDMVFLTGVDGNDENNDADEVGNQAFAYPDGAQMTSFHVSSAFNDSLRPPLHSHSRDREQQMRSIPVPEYLHVPPLQALKQSVSTLDVLIAKTNYSNIHTNRLALILYLLDWKNVR